MVCEEGLCPTRMQVVSPGSALLEKMGSATQQEPGEGSSPQHSAGLCLKPKIGQVLAYLLVVAPNVRPNSIVHCAAYHPGILGGAILELSHGPSIHLRWR